MVFVFKLFLNQFFIFLYNIVLKIPWTKRHILFFVQYCIKSHGQKGTFYLRSFKKPNLSLKQKLLKDSSLYIIIK